MDYQATNLIAGGYSLDPDIGMANTQQAVLIGIIADNFHFALSFSSITDFKQVAVTPDGSIFAALTINADVIMTFTATTGDLLKAKGITDKTITKMIFSDTNVQVLTEKDTTGYQVLSLTITDFLISWAYTSGSTTTQPLEISQTPDAKYLHVLHQFSENSVLLTTFLASSGIQKDSTEYSLASTSGFTLASSSPSIFYIISTNLASVCRSNYSCYELASGGYKVVSTYAQFWQLNVLFTQSGQTGVIVFNFNNNTVRSYQVTVWPDVTAGKLDGMQIAAVLSQVGDFKMGATGESAPIVSAFKYSAIVRSPGNTCQANTTSQLQPSPPFTTSSVSSQSQFWQYETITTLTLVDKGATLAPTISIIPSTGLIHPNVDDFCKENNLLLRNSGAFTKKQLSFKVGIASTLESPSISKVTCSGSGEVTTSSFGLTMADGVSLLPSYITFDPLTGNIFVSTSGEEGTVNLKVTQSLSNGQSNSYLLDLTGNSNAPDFATPLVDLTVPLNGVPISYTLPSVYLDAGASLASLSALLKISPDLYALPSFITFSSNLLQIFPNQYQFSAVGTYEIEFSLTQSDGKISLRQLFIFITNSAPYLTTEVPTTILLPIDFTSTASLSIGQQDDEGHSITTLVRRQGQTSLPSFMSFINPLITIAPSSFSHVGIYTIEIMVSDGGSMSSSYLFTVDVTNTAPYFVTFPLENQYCVGSNPITFTLPNYQDDENNPVTVTLTGSYQISKTINLASRTITITPQYRQYYDSWNDRYYYYLYYGLYTVNVQLGDTNMASTYSFTVNVTNGAPFFQTSFPSFTMVLGFEYTYDLPSIKTFETGTPLISINSKPYYITINGITSLTFKPIQNGDLGYKYVDVYVEDSDQYSYERLYFTIADNQKPAFSVSSLPSLTIKLNSTHTINLPSYSDYEEQPVTVTYSYGYLESTIIDENTTTVKTTNFSLVGDNVVNVTLDDSFRQKLYQFTITVTNSAPYINLPLQNWRFDMNNTYYVTLPAFNDDEGNPVSVVSQSLPSFVTFASPNSFSVYATSFSMLSSELVYFTLTDSQLESITYSFTVEIYNTAPFFEQGPPLPNVTMRFFNPLTIELPLIKDNQSNPVFITAASNKSSDPILFSFTEQAPNFWSLTLLPKRYDYVWTPTLITITLDDTNLQTTYTFVLTVTNEAPVFVSSALDMVVNQKMNDLMIYTWPAYMDPEGDIDSVIVQIVNNTDQQSSPHTFTSSFSYLTLSQTDVTVQATQFSQVGVTKFLIALSDGQPKTTLYSISMTITNTAPYFFSSSTGKLGTVRIRLGDYGSFTIPPYKDDEGNQVFVTNEALPEFVRSNGEGSYYFSPSSVQDIGVFQIDGEISDGQPLSSKFTFKVVVFNEPPFFVETLQTKILAPLGLKTVYIFPKIKDAEMLPIEMKVLSLSSWPKFVTIVKNGTEIWMSMDPDSVEQIKDYQLSVELKDAGKASKMYFITISVEDLGVAQQSIDEQKKNKIAWTNIQKVGLEALQVSNNGVVTVRLTNSQGITINTIEKKYFQINVLGKEDNVDFEIERFQNSQLSIRLNFRDVDRISSSVYRDTLHIVVIESYYMPISPLQALLLSKGMEDTVQIPKQYSQKAVDLVAKFSNGASIVTSAAVPGGILINLSLSMFIQYMWGLLNDLSFLTAMTLISYPVPGIAQLIQASMLSFIYLDILQTDKWLSPLIFPESADDDEGAPNSINQQFYQNGFQDMMLIQNLGSTFIYLLGIVLGFVVMLVTRVNFGVKWMLKVTQWLEGKLVWSFCLRFLMQQYPPLIISSLINLYDFDLNTPGKRLSSALSVVILITSQLVTIALLYKVNTSSVTSIEFQSKYGTLHEGMNTSTFIGRNWSVLIMIRWSATSLIMVLLRDYYCLQVQSLLLTSFLYISLVVIGRPFVVGLNNAISGFNEFMISAYLYTLMMLMMADTEQYETLGNLLIVVIALSAFVNLSKFVFVVSKAIKAKKSDRKQQLLQQKNQIKVQIYNQPSVNDATKLEDFEDNQPNAIMNQEIKASERIPRKILIKVKKHQAPVDHEFLEIQRNYRKVFGNLELNQGQNKSIWVNEQ